MEKLPMENNRKEIENDIPAVLNREKIYIEKLEEYRRMVDAYSLKSKKLVNKIAKMFGGAPLEGVRYNMVTKRAEVRDAINGYLHNLYIYESDNPVKLANEKKKIFRIMDEMYPDKSEGDGIKIEIEQQIESAKRELSYILGLIDVRIDKLLLNGLPPDKISSEASRLSGALKRYFQRKIGELGLPQYLPVKSKSERESGLTSKLNSINKKKATA